MSAARDRTLSHLQRLVAAATVLGAGAATATAGCKKETVSPEGDASPDAEVDTGASSDASDDAAAQGSPVADPDATAPSTLDSTAFADAGGPHAKKDAGKPPKPHPAPHPHGYAVVDPMPPPVRLPKGTTPKPAGCDTPFYFDSEGRKHYKPECLK